MTSKVSQDDASATPEFQFTFRHGGVVLARFGGAATEFIIGTEAGCDVLLEIDGVAPRHARLWLREAAFLSDLDSGVGTYIDGEEIGAERVLRPGQSITFGYAEGELFLEEPAPQHPEGDAGSAPEGSAAAPATDEARVKAEAEAAAKAAEEAAAARAVEEARVKAEAEAVAKAAEEAAAAKAAEEARVKAEAEAAAKAAEEAAAAKAAEEARLRAETETAASVPALHCWDAPSTFEGSQWSEAILQGAAAPRKGEIFDIPPETGSEVSITWQSDDSPPARSVSSAPHTTVSHPSPAPDPATESERLSAELIAAKAPPEGAQQSSAAIVTGDRSFLSLTNGFLLKKLAATNDSKKEIAELTKEVKKRELALVEAWSRRQAAEEQCLELSQRLAQKEGAGGAPARPAINQKVVWVSVALIAAGFTLLGMQLREVNRRVRQSEGIVELLRSVAPQLHREAEAALVAGRLEEALAKVERALALEPDRASFHLTLGHVRESLLRIPEAQAAYARAVALDPSLTSAVENLELCRAINATREGVMKVENLYGLHRLMLAQKRLSEALRVAQRIGRDGPMLRRTWEAILQAGGIRGDLRLNDDGTFDLELLAGTSSDLSPLRDLPLRSFTAARANISDISPLEGMLSLRHLDLSETMVREISVLRGLPLETLNLSHTSVTNLVPLHGMPLRVLRLDYTGVAEIADLGGLPLKSLSLLGTRVQSIAALSQMPLRQLDLTGTTVKDLTALKHAPLEELNLEGTPVSDLSPLAGAPLVSLTLSGTRVSSLEALSGAPLRELRLIGCQAIESLNPLAACLELERLVLPRRGMDIAPLQNLSRLRFLSFEAEAAPPRPVPVQIPATTTSHPVTQAGG